MRDRVLPPQRPPALPIPRRKLTRVEFAQLMLDQDGRCAACREKLRADLIVDEHLVPLDQLGTTDDCGFSPFSDDISTSRDVAFAKIAARVAGTAAAAQLG